jgi:putative transcriptional regulator
MDDVVHVGGPVQSQAIVVLGDFHDPADAAALVVGSVGFLRGEIESADDVGALERARVFAGYAGWGPGQLEGEIAESSWFIEPALPDDVFTGDPEGLWSAVLRRKGGPFAVLATIPIDPSAN